MTTPWTRERVAALGATTDLMTAADIVGISRSLVYDLAKHRPEKLPFRTLRVGTRYRVPTSSILDALGLEATDGVDWRAEAKKWERRAKDHLRVVRSLQAVLGVDEPELDESA